MENNPTTFGTQTETFKVIGGQEHVMIVNEETGKVVMALSDTEAIELATILREEAESGN